MAYKEARKFDASLIVAAIKKAEAFTGFPNLKPVTWEGKKMGKVLRRIK